MPGAAEPVAGHELGGGHEPVAAAAGSFRAAEPADVLRTAEAARATAAETQLTEHSSEPVQPDLPTVLTDGLLTKKRLRGSTKSTLIFKFRIIKGQRK